MPERKLIEMHKSKEISVLQQYKQRIRNQDTSRTTSLQEKIKIQDSSQKQKSK